MESVQDKSIPNAKDEVEETTGRINRMDIALQNDIRHAAARYYDPDVDDLVRDAEEEEDFIPPSRLHFTFRRTFRNLELRGLQGKASSK